MKSNKGAFRFLVELGVLSGTQVERGYEAHVEQLVEFMIGNKSLSMGDSNKASKILSSLVRSPNRFKKMKLQMDMIALVAANIHSRVDASRLRAKKNKDRATSGSFVAVPSASK